MKVKALIHALQMQDPDADVVLCFQPNYPLEYSLQNVTVRLDTLDDPEDPTWEGREGAKKEDVLLACGSHLRYGAREAWQD